MPSRLRTRVLLAGPPFLGEVSGLEIAAYLRQGASVVVNDFLWAGYHTAVVRESLPGDGSVQFTNFDPRLPEALVEVIDAGAIGFDAIVCPPSVSALTTGAFQAIIGRCNVEHRLRAIGCPNDSISHIREVSGLAARNDVVIINVPGVHAQSVAEYTISQIGFHARGLQSFYDATGVDDGWPHLEAMAAGRLLMGKTLGVIGGSGSDGSAVVELAIKYGLRVVAMGSGSSSAAVTIRSLGAEVADDIDDLLTRADFLSVNCRPTDRTFGLIGQKQIAFMRRGTIIINPSFAEVFEKGALFEEFAKPIPERRIATLVLDMPYGGRRDSSAFAADADNARLKSLGVRFTPRMAGYTIEAYSRASVAVAEYVARYLKSNDLRVPVANRQQINQPPLCDLRALLEDAIRWARLAAKEAIRMRESGLELEYKGDGSPATDADVATENMIRDGLRSQGYVFSFSGEESKDLQTDNEAMELVIDGIDGTRNFRDGNYGWCVSIAVVMNRQTEMAIVYDPLCNEAYYAIKGGGAFVRASNGVKGLTVPKRLYKDFSFSVGSFRVKGSTKIKNLIVEDIKLLGGRGREWGSVALSICAVARGGLGAFIQGNSHRHDHLGALLVAEESGANVVRNLNSDSASDDIIVAHPSLFAQIAEIFAKRTGSSSN